MSESTVNFGLDVTTGNSTTSVDNLTTSVDGLLVKYTALMEEMGKGDQVFGKVVKALGGHKGELDAAAREIDKVQKAMSGGTLSKGYTADISSEFKGLAQDLKSAISGIPVEIKAATTQISGMTTIMQNQLGGIGVTLRELKDSLLDVGNAADNTKRKTAQISGKPKIEGQTPDLGTALANKFNLEAKVQFRTEDQTIDYIQNILREADKLDKVLSNVSQNQILDTVKAKQVEGLVRNIGISMQDLKVANVDMAGAAGRAMTELSTRISQTNTKLKEVKSLTADKYVLSLKIDVPNINDLKDKIASVSQTLSKDTIETSNLDQLLTKQRELLNLRKQAAYLKSPEDKAAISGMLIPLQEEIGLRKEQSKKITEAQKLEAAKYDAGIARQLQQRKEVEAYFQKSGVLLKQQILEKEQADKKEAMSAKMLAEIKLKTSAQSRTQVYVDEYKKAGSDLVALDALSSKITKELIANRKSLGTVSQNVSKETTQALKEEIVKREELLRTVKAQITVQELGVGTSNKQGIGEQVRDLIQVLAKAEDATRSFGKTSQGTIFESIEDMRTYKEQILSVREVLTKKLADKGLNSQIKEAINSQIADLDMAQEIITKYFGRGLNVRGTAQVINPEAIRLKEEIDLLNKYQDITDRVRQAKEKLNQTKGSKSDTLQARKEMEGLRIEQEKLQAEMQKTSKLFSAAGMSGSKAMDDIRNASKKLNNEMASFKGTISATEYSFKNMWGSVTVALGKFMLAYHTLSIAIGAVRSAFSGMSTFLDSMMTRSEVVMNLQKSIVAMNMSLGDTRGIEKSRKEFEYYKKTVNDLGVAYKDVKDSFLIMKTFADKEGGNYEKMMDLWKRMIEAAKGLGKMGDIQEFFKGFTDVISKGQVMSEELRGQLAEKLPGVIEGVSREIAKLRNIDVKDFNIFDEMKKRTLDLSEFMAGFYNFLPKWAELGKTQTDAYSSAVARLSNAWDDLLMKLATGPVGQKVTEMLTDLTERLKDPSVAIALEKAAVAMAQIFRYLTDVVEYLLPQIGREIRNMPGVSKATAAANPVLAQAAQASVNQANTLTQVYNTQQGMGVVKDMVDSVLGSFAGTFSKRKEELASEMTNIAASYDIPKLVAEGWFQVSKEGILKGSSSAKEALENKVDEEFLKTKEGLSERVITPLINFLASVDGDLSKLDDFLSTVVDRRTKAMGEYKTLAIEALPGIDGWRKAPQEASKVMGKITVPEAPKPPATAKEFEGYNLGKVADSEAETKVKALAKSLENIQDQINKASMGKWAYEFAQVTHELKEFEIELGDKAAPQIAELGAALRKEFGENFARGLEEFDTSLDMAIRSGKYGKELQTSFDSINKTYKDNLKKIEDDYKGLSLAEVTQAELDKVSQLKTKAENAKVAGYEAAIESAIVSEKMLAKVQVQGAEKTVQEIMAIRNNETKDVVELEKQLVAEVDRLSQEGYNRKVANIEKATEAEIKQGVAAVDAFKWQERKKQEELDKSLELRIASTENFTDYLNMRFAKEQGLFDNPTVATTKQFEKMYDIIGSGASEMGQTIQESFTEAFTGTLKSWTDTWKSIQATFLKGLAAMIWEAKMRPIQLSIVSALTGFGTGTPALAAGATGEQLAQGATAAQGTTGEGVFSTLTKSITSLTKGVNTFGKDVLNMTSDLSNALIAGGIGFGVAKVMFPENQMAQIGGTIGSAAGQVFGEVFGEEIGATLGPVGAIIGGVAGSMIGKLFQKETKVTDYGIRVSVDEQGLKFLDKYEKLKKSGGFDISSIAGLATFAATGMGTPLAWQSGSKRERYTDVDPQVYKQISAAITTSFSTVSRQMLSLGLAPNFAGFSIDEKVSLKGKDPEALLQAWLNKLSGKMVDTALANDSVQASFAAAKKMGETSSDALTRLVEAMTALETGAIKANVSIEALAGGLSGIDLASFASDFSEALGGSSNVNAFFDRIEKFIGYTGTQGITNFTAFEDKFKSAIDNINSYSGQSGTRVSVLSGQKANLELTQSAIETKLEQFAAGAGWRKWLSFQDGELVMNPGSKYSTVEEMAAADPKWKAVLDPMIAYVKELKLTNQALANVETKLGREETLPQAAMITAGSATFWGDYQKALSQEGGLTPELAAAWDAAAQVAESLAEMRDSAIAAREELEKQAVTYNEQRATLQLSAQFFGASAMGLKSLSLQAQELNQNDLPQWFNQVGNQIAEGLVPGLVSFNRTGETALDTLVRLTNIFQSTEQAAALAGTNLANLSGGLTGLGAANYAQTLSDFFGGADVVSGIFQNIGEAIYTDDESKDIAKAYWKNQAEAQAAALGTDLAGAKEWIKNQLANPLSAEQIQNINILATSINNMEDAAGTSADAIDDLADYMQDLTDKILTMGMTDTQEFIFNLKKEVKDMYDTILDKGGTEEQASLAYKYQAAAIRQRLDETMKDINLSIRKLVSPDLIEQLNQLSDSYWEQVQAATLLGATQEELNAILYNSYLQAKEVLASAANAYIAAYDAALSNIEELKNKQQALEDDVNDKRNGYMASLKKEIDLKQEAIDKLQENVDKLKDFITSLKDLKVELATSAGFLSPLEKAGVTLSEFYKTANLASKGDTVAMGNLSSQAQAALDAASSGSYDDYIRTFASIYSTVSDLEASAQAQLDPQQQQLDALIASKDTLQDIYAELEKLNDTTLTIDAARTAYETAQATLAASTYNDQIAAAQIEADRHKSTIELLRSQYANDLTLSAAATTFFTIKKTIEEAVEDPNKLAASYSTGSSTTSVSEPYDFSTIMEVYGRMETTANASNVTLATISTDVATTKNIQREMSNTLSQIEDYLYPEKTTDGSDKGIKVIVAATSVRDGVLLALRSANTMSSIPTTSVIGLLNSINNAGGGVDPTCTYATDTTGTSGCSSSVVTTVTDTLGLAPVMTETVFNTVEAALVYSRQFGVQTLTEINFSFSTEDPNCSVACYFIG